MLLAGPATGIMSAPSDAEVEAVVDAQLGAVKELDEDIFAYILGIVKDVDAHGCDPETLAETVRQRQRTRGIERPVEGKKRWEV